MSFRDMVAADNKNVFLNLNEFAEMRTVICDEETFRNVPMVISGMEEKDRRQLESDHAQGLYLVTSVLHCAINDLNGKLPEKGTRIRIQDEVGSAFYRNFYVASSVCEMGMLRVELEAIDE